ncbi:MAG: lysine-sensitive aspartokinase 3 [Bacteroidetes bacterium]|nr:lysine-sensitive aspartokinase 3 [Bacteroidota bacterium]
MLVMKYGGTSVGSAQRIADLTKIVQTYHDKDPIVVVSAMSGVTNLLVEACEKAKIADFNSFYRCVDEITQKHLQCIENLFDGNPEQLKPLYEFVLSHIKEIRNLLEGIAILKELTPRTSDLINSYGERISSMIVTYALNSRGIPAQHVDARDVVITDGEFGSAKPLQDKINQKSAEHIIPVVKSGKVPVMGGYIGRTTDGITSTLGRGGSDYTAAVIGLAVNATEIQIWTDVDGILTCDPRLIPHAKVLSKVSFNEASEMAFFGAKVLHPSTIKPAVENNIPVKILNSFNPGFPGTLITNETDANQAIKAIAFKRKVTVLSISSPKLLFGYGYMAKLFSVFEKYKTSIDLVATSEVSVSMSLDSTDQIGNIVSDLSQFADVKVENELAIISVVGMNFSSKSGIASKIFSALKQVNIKMISFGASDINFTLVVDMKELDGAVKDLHRVLFEEA